MRAAGVCHGCGADDRPLKHGRGRFCCLQKCQDKSKEVIALLRHAEGKKQYETKLGRIAHQRGQAVRRGLGRGELWLVWVYRRAGSVVGDGCSW